MSHGTINRSVFSFFDFLYFVIGIPWLFLILFTATTLTEVKTAMLLLLVVVCILEICFKRISCNLKQLGFVVLFSSFAILEILIGMLNGYEFDVWGSEFPLIQYYIATPLFVFILSSTIKYKPLRREGLWSILKYMTLVLTVLDLLRILLIMVGVSPWFLEFIPIANVNTGDLIMRVTNETSLFFLLPVFIYVLINPQSESKMDRFIYVVIVVAGVIYSLMSGRKILELLVAFSFLVSFIYKKGKIKIGNLFSASMIKAYIIFLILLVVLYFILEFIGAQVGADNIFSTAMDTLINGLANEDVGIGKRLGNADALLDLWMESPIWGNGLQSYARNSIASTATHWSYEVFYVAWLAQTGIIGCILLLMPMLYIIRRLSKTGVILNDYRYYAILLGFICFMISGATNPMLYLIWPWTLGLSYSTPLLK